MPPDDTTVDRPEDRRPARETIGTRGLSVGPFELVDRLGAGGMGEVWSARHTVNGLPVALKLIRRTAHESRDADSPIIEEFRMLRDVHHPNVVRVHDTGRCTIDGDAYPWVAMELLPGARAIDVYAEGRPLEERLQTIHQAFCGLAKVHQLGGKHLDVKPDNILVDEDGRAVLTDFGLARPMLGWRDEHAAGTPHYMSPEQCRNFDRADQRSDVWSCGLVLAELATAPAAPPIPAVPPDDEESTTSGLYGGHVVRTLADAYPDMASELSRIVRRCLEEDPARRYENAGALADELGRLLERFQHAGVRADLAARRRRVTAALLVTMAGVIGAAVGLATTSAQLLLWLDVPVDWYGRFLGPQRASLAQLTELPDVVLVRVDDQTVNDVIQRPELGELGVNPYVVWSRRPLYGVAYERLANAGAAVIVSDIFFSTEKPVDDQLAASIRRVRAQGVGVVIGVNSMRFDQGRPPMSLVVWDAGPAWGVATMNDSPTGHWWTYLGVEREGMSVIPPLAVAAFAEFAAPGVPHEYAMIDRRLRIRHPSPTDDPRGARRFTGESWLAATNVEAFDPSRHGAVDGSMLGDIQSSFAFAPPDADTVDASTISLADIWTLSDEMLQRRIGGRIVVFYDHDRDTQTEHQGAMGGQVHAAAIQTMILRTQERVAVAWNIPWSLGVGLAAAALTLLAGRRGRRIIAAALVVAIASAGTLAIAWVVHRASGVWLHPLSAIVAALVAAMLIAWLGARLDSRPRFPESVT